MQLVTYGVGITDFMMFFTGEEFEELIRSIGSLKEVGLESVEEIEKAINEKDYKTALRNCDAAKRLIKKFAKNVSDSTHRIETPEQRLQRQQEEKMSMDLFMDNNIEEYWS